MNKKLDVHMVQHTHWDREWYFTSDDSRTMLYYDMKFLIDYLEKNDDVFTYDGQSSVIDDFLKYSPDWKKRFQAVVKAKKLFVGPFYTQIDDTITAGESILRNLSIGIKVARGMGHSMEVGYLPDTFGHNNQIPQILKMNGLNNISFYRGLDPKDTDNKIFFNYEGQDGTNILGHWQTHYSTNSKAFAYTTKAFEDHIVADYKKIGSFGPSVKSYAKRNLNLPITIPIGTDQRPFNKNVKTIVQKLNKNHKEFNFIVSDYETALKEVAKQIKEKKIKLKNVTGELRQALTGRVHRSILSSRVDIKQVSFKLESTLIDVLEPLSILCLVNDIDVPWRMIEHVWKELFKSSAHDSFGNSNEDIVNRKLKMRVETALRIAKGLIAMLSRIFSNKVLDEKNDEYNKFILFNLQQKHYSGLYEFEINVKRGYEDGKFKLYDNGKEVKYAILNRNNIGTHERDALTIILKSKDVPAFSYKILDIKYFDKIQYKISNENEISNGQISLKILKDEIIIKKNNKEFSNLLRVASDPSVGDTYDHSPITMNDKKYILGNYKILETNLSNHTIKIEASTMVPSGIEDWTNNKVSVKQNLTIQFTLIDDKVHVKLYVRNKSKNQRMILLVSSLSKSTEWYHDQQFGIYKRSIINKYEKTWDKPDKYGYKWDEYPTLLSPHQSFISNNESSLTIYTEGTREHEMIKFKGINTFAITLFRAFGKFGTSKVCYRPGRASGARTDAPECQILDTKLTFDFVIDINETTLQNQFDMAKWMKQKNHYIPGEWGLDRTILRWETDIDYYDKDKNSRKSSIQIPEDIVNNPAFIFSAMHLDSQERIVARFLNVGEPVFVRPAQQKLSRDLIKFTTDEVKVPKFGLINVLIRS